MLRDTSITKSHLYSYHFIPLLLAHPRQDAALRPSQGRASWQECGALRAPERTRGRRLLLPPPAGPSPRGRLFSSSLPALPAGTSLTSSFVGRLLPGSPAGLFPPCLALSSTLRGRRPSNDQSWTSSLRPTRSRAGAGHLPRPSPHGSRSRTGAGHLHRVPPGVGPESDIFPVLHPMIAGVGPELDIFTASHQE